MIEEWLWIGFYIMVLGFILLIPNAFAPCTCPSFGKSMAVIGAIVGTIGGLMAIVSLLL